MPEIDLTRYRRRGPGITAPGVNLAVASASFGFGRFTAQAELQTIAELGYGMDPRAVPVSALQLMGCNPAIYLAERTISGIVRRPDLYSVRHKDPKIVAETEAWLWPLLGRLTAAAARAFSYGTVAVVLDWDRRTLRVMVPGKNGKERARTLVRHTHFVRAFEVHPDETLLLIDEQGAVDRITALGGTYGAGRVHVWAWDPEFGSVVGQGARRRSWRDYCEHMILTVLRDKYLERSVDSPRVSYSPDGEIEIDGVKYRIPEYVGQLLDEARGSGSINLPSKRDSNGEKLYELDVLEVPDRNEVWDASLNRCESNMFLAFLVSSTLSGGLDDAGGAASRTLEGMLREHVEDLANWVAEGLTRIVDLVHAANYDPEQVDPPEIVATDVGKAAARKIMQQVLSLAVNAQRGEVALRTDIPALLDKLGIPLRSEPPEFPEGWGGEGGGGGTPPGRPRDMTSDREQRREDARTEEGEEDTGAPRDEDGEPEKTGDA